MKCSSTNPKAIKAANAFPDRLAAVHEGRIVLRDDAVYKGSQKPIEVHCTVCDHSWEPEVHSLVINKSGCPACAVNRRKMSAGKLRLARATEAEKQKARELRSQGLTYSDIAKELKRSQKAVRNWIDSKQASRSREASSAWLERNREKANENRRCWYRTVHGYSNAHYHSNLRRAEIEADIIGMSDRDLQRINNFYEVAMLLNKEAGYTAYHVDHIIPLAKGGVHSHENLQILTASENLAKNAKIRPEDVATYQRNVAELFGPYSC